MWCVASWLLVCCDRLSLTSLLITFAIIRFHKVLSGVCLPCATSNKPHDAKVNQVLRRPPPPPPPPRAILLPPDPHLRSEYKTHVAVTVCHCGIHTHSFTCKKPPKGWHGCRLCYQKGLSNGTKPVELVYTIQPDGTIEWYELEPEKQKDAVSMFEVNILQKTNYSHSNQIAVVLLFGS